MPGGDRTGPLGQGPMTGRGAGYCGGSANPGYMNQGLRRGAWGGGRGFRGCGGYGWRNWYYATGMPGWARAPWGFGPRTPYGAPFGRTMTQKEELELLQEQAQDLSDTLDDIKKRMQELSAKET